MPLYKKPATEEPKTVWLVNPVGRVVEVLETAPEVSKRDDGVDHWRDATPEQIKQALAQREADAEEARQHAEDRAAGRKVAATLVEAAKSVKRGPGRPRKHVEEAAE